MAEQAGYGQDDIHGSVSWVQCDKCAKWRQVPAELAERLGDDEPWDCSLNPVKQFASCEVPQELTNEEIDNGSDEEDELEMERRRRARMPAVWQLVRDNQLGHRKRKIQDEDDIMICQCKPVWRGGDGCGPDCINRMLCIECVSGFCPCEEHCTNQVFAKKQYAKLEVKRAGPKGFGLFACQDIKAGQFLIEYIGEVLEEEEYLRRKEFYQEVGQRHYYFMNVGNGEVIDACRKGNHARFINHSCDPNCETQKWLVRGELAIGLFAVKDIANGEELTFDYNFERYGDKPMRCHCGQKACRGTIGGTGAQDPAAAAALLAQLEAAEARGEVDDASNDLPPIMVTDADMDGYVKAILDWRVGTTIPANREDVVLGRLLKLCKVRNIEWTPVDYYGGEGAEAAAVEAAAAASSDETDKGGAMLEDDMEADDQEQDEPAKARRARRTPAQAAAAARRKAAAAAERKEAREQQRLRKASHKAASTSGGSGAVGPVKEEGGDDAVKEEADQPQFRGPLKAAFKQMKAAAKAEPLEEGTPGPTAAERKQEPGSSVTGIFAALEKREGSRVRQRVRPAVDRGRGKEAAGEELPSRRGADREGVGGASSSALSVQSLAGGSVSNPPSRRASMLTPLGGGSSLGTGIVLGKGGFRRRSEIDRRLDTLIGPSGRLKDPSRLNIIKVLRMFNLCDIGGNKGGQGPGAQRAAAGGACGADAGGGGASGRGGGEHSEASANTALGGGAEGSSAPPLPPPLAETPAPRPMGIIAAMKMEHAAREQAIRDALARGEPPP